jgi:hypothetical protein
MSDFNALYHRYLEEANAYASKFGLDPKTASNDGHRDAFRHAYASAAMTKDYGRIAAHLFGDLNEVRGDLGGQWSYSKHTWTDGTMLLGVALRQAPRIRTRWRVEHMTL